MHNRAGNRPVFAILGDDDGPHPGYRVLRAGEHGVFRTLNVDLHLRRNPDSRSSSATMRIAPVAVGSTATAP